MIYFILCYIISICSYLIMIKLSTSHNIRQTEREEGPKSHQKKNGTLTMGGIIFSLVPVILFLIRQRADSVSLLISFGLLTFFSLGALDDLKVIKLKNNEGMGVKIRLFIEFGISFIILIWLSYLGNNTNISLGKLNIKLGYFYYILMVIFMTGIVNSFNLTDGIDSLLSSMAFIIALGLIFISIKDNNSEITFFLLLLVISLASFYVLNYPRAQIFMGNTGSLALGGVLCVISFILNAEGLFFIMCIPLIFETVSDIIQVLYFKITKGKRFFKMAPFHHHLEILGYSEKLITALFSLVEIIFVFIALILGGYF